MLTYILYLNSSLLIVPQLLTAVPSHPRTTLQTQTLDSAKTYEREMRHRIQRMNILNAELEVRAKKIQGPNQGQNQGPNTSDLDTIYDPRRTRFGASFDSDYD
jgi:hypothetical protein